VVQRRRRSKKTIPARASRSHLVPFLELIVQRQREQLEAIGDLERTLMQQLDEWIRDIRRGRNEFIRDMRLLQPDVDHSARAPSTDGIPLR
jgi:hypothetical protein